MDTEDDEFVYKLVGVTLHVGTAEHGHYYSLINTKRNPDEVDESKPEWFLTEKDQWKVFEDDKIKPYSFSDLKVDSFGGTSQSMTDHEMDAYLSHTGVSSFGKNAYMLVYERKSKRALKEVVLAEEKREDITVSMDCGKSESFSTNEKIPATLDCVDTATSRAAEDIKASSVSDGSTAT